MVEVTPLRSILASSP